MNCALPVGACWQLACAPGLGTAGFSAEHRKPTPGVQEGCPQEEADRTELQCTYVLLDFCASLVLHAV